MNRSFRNQCFEIAVMRSVSIRWPILRSARLLRRGERTLFGAPMSPSYFGHLVLEDQVVAEGVPGQLAGQAVILMQVVGADG